MIVGVATRKYEQQLRAESAEQTRRAVLDAAYARLRAAPTEPLSVGAVAEQARVARSTVYLVFGSRAGLFDALATDLLDRGRVHRLYEAVGHPDAREHLRGALRASCDMFAVDRDVRRCARIDVGTGPRDRRRHDRPRGREPARRHRPSRRPAAASRVSSAPT